VLTAAAHLVRGNEFTATLERLGARHSRIHAAPQTNGNVEALRKTILDECRRPVLARYLYPRYSGLRRALSTYSSFHNHDHVRHGRLAQGTSRRTSSKGGVLFGYRQQLSVEAARTSVSATVPDLRGAPLPYYAWRRQVDRRLRCSARASGADAHVQLGHHAQPFFTWR
jgi:hypothetical protein